MSDISLRIKLYFLSIIVKVKLWTPSFLKWLYSIDDYYYHRFDQLETSDVSHNLNPTATYSISRRNITPHIHHGLVDGGANGGIGSDRDICILAFDPDNHQVNISGVNNHLVNNMRIASFCAVSQSQLGLVLLVYNQYAYVPEQTQFIHSKIKMQDFCNLVCDNSNQSNHTLTYHITIILYYQV